jgi:osmotically-inducible protein OsmY
MKSNEQLQKDVQDAIKWQPLIGAAEIGVTANNGVVTLSGHVNSYAKKVEAETAAKNVVGVKAIVEELLVKITDSNKSSDEDIANEALTAMKWDWSVPSDKIKVKVEDGWVNLDGRVKWNYQREAAKKCIMNLSGVKGVINNISLEVEPTDNLELESIENALSRSWLIDDRNIQVKVKGNKVTLRGAVESLFERDEAARLAWNAPGVNEVENELAVIYDMV